MTVTDARGKQTSYTYDLDGRKTAEYDTTGGALESTATELASWTYDTLAKGQLTSATAYDGGASYTEQVTGYNSQELPSGTETIIPSAQGALAGTYTTSYTYAPTGQQTSYTDSAAGGLPQETVTTGYDNAGNPDSLTGASSYVDSLSYTNLGQPLQYTMGTSGEPAYITDTWDPQTGRLTEQNTQTTTAKTSVDDLNYSYDEVGNVKSEADTPSGDSAATDVQCFQYDYLGRLTQAWAQGTAGCAATPSASAEGGAAPYWNAYSYDVTGNLTELTSTAQAGAVTTMAATYPAAGKPQPHAISSQTVTSPSGSQLTSYNYDAAGRLVSSSGPSQDQALTWGDSGHLTQDAITPSGGTAQNASYIYDADGTLLVDSDPGVSTLYLSDEELSLSSGAVTGTRYYSIGSTIVATLTGASSISFLSADQQGTSAVAVDASTLSVTRRWFDPYGNPRGPVPAAFLSGQKAFVGGTADNATGLTNLGAREYQPGNGNFISPDPILKPLSPQDLNPYAYASGNPSTYSDPSGTDGSPDILPHCGQANTGPCGNSGGGGQVCARGQTVTQVGAVLFPCNYPYLRAIEGEYKYEMQRGMTDGLAGVAGEINALEAACGVVPCGMITNKLLSIHESIVGAAFGGMFNPSLYSWGEYGEGTSTDGSDEALTRLLGAELNANEGASELDNMLGTCNSFTGNTRVLLASRKSVPIRDLHIGDKVIATDPLTGKTAAERVTRFIVTTTDEDFTILTLGTPTGRATIVSTTHHPYWDVTTRRWTDAGALRPGDYLYSAARQRVTVTGIYNYLGHAVTYNVTIADLHTYYVDAGATSVLVHNNDFPCGFDYDAAYNSGLKAVGSDANVFGQEYQKRMDGGYLPKVKGPQNINSAGEQLAQEVLTDPDAEYSLVEGGQFKGGHRISALLEIDGKVELVKMIFSSNGQFRYFGF